MADVFQHTASIHAARKPQEEARGDKEQKPKEAASLEVSPVEWGMILGICGIASIIEFVAAETILIPFFVNYASVFIIWFWAKIKGMKPPTFARNAAKVGSLAKVVEEHEGVQKESAMEKGADSIPGMDLVYIGLGGINPFLYAVALFIGNMN